MPFQRDPQGHSFVQNWLGLITQIAAAADDLYASDWAHGELIKVIGEKLEKLLADSAGTRLQVARLEEEVAYLSAELSASVRWTQPMTNARPPEELTRSDSVVSAANIGGELHLNPFQPFGSPPNKPTPDDRGDEAS
ncbi:MAG: hypothetical protein JO081_00310 [Alphaproteobacteria bacterium]|nr:hypothetical protein [Alphaproteobacteria bacterium]